MPACTRQRLRLCRRQALRLPAPTPAVCCTSTLSPARVLRPLSLSQSALCPSHTGGGPRPRCSPGCCTPLTQRSSSGTAVAAAAATTAAAVSSPSPPLSHHLPRTQRPPLYLKGVLGEKAAADPPQAARVLPEPLQLRGARRGRPRGRPSVDSRQGARPIVPLRLTGRARLPAPVPVVELHQVRHQPGPHALRGRPADD